MRSQSARISVFVMSWLGIAAAAMWGCRGQEDRHAQLPVVPATKPYGIEARVPWTASHVTGTPEPPPAYRMERVFPKLAFASPVDVAFAPGSSRVFVVEQSGKILSFPNDQACAQADLFADLRNEVQNLDKIPDCKGVDNAYGIAFHPRFAENHFVYICYVLGPLKRARNFPNGTRISRFTVTTTDPPHIEPASEVILLEWIAGGHNGGCIKFGPDGYLYASSGDAGDPNPPDPFNSGQDISDLLCSVIRIDVDHPASGKNYGIPSDNPFVHTPAARPEVWAYGFRNPWRMNFDRETGNLWVGDVGWELWESVSCAVSGGNYGWSIMEGPNPVHPNGKRGPTPITPPQAALPHTEAASLTGGIVYRGTRLPALKGHYIFGDWMTLRLWAAKCIGEHGDKLEPYRVIAETTQKIVAFGEQPDGELLIADYGGGGSGGGLWRIVPSEAVNQTQKFPRKLSETGLFSSTQDQTPETGVIPFSINASQWVDGATAERWVAAPGKGSVTWGVGPFGEDKPAWPSGSVLVRTLSLEGTGKGGMGHRTPIETQLLHFDGQQWRGYSYAWNDAHTDADLIGAAGEVRTLSIPDPGAADGVRKERWHYQSRAQCVTCHNTWCDYTLAFNAKQLDRPHNFGSVTDNEVRTFQHIGLLLAPKPSDKPRDPTDTRTLTDPYDTSADLYERARSYLDVNCSHCHRFGAGGAALFDVRKELLLGKTNLVDARPNLGAFGITDARIISPGDACKSVMLYRIAKLGSDRMPRIGSDVVDAEGVELIRQWAASLGTKTDAHAQDLLLLQATEPSRRVTSDAIDRLLATTDGALALACEVQRRPPPNIVRELATQHGLASTDGLIRDLFRRFDPAEQTIERLGADIDPGKILPLTGDAARGRAVFFKLNGGLCARCHRVGPEGADFGPDLSHIATKYKRAEILDNIINPSKTILDGYATYFIRTKTGDVYTGLLVSKSDSEIVLKDATLKPIRLPAASVERMVQQSISAMPDGLLGDLEAQQAADLVEFLTGQK